MTVSGRFGKFLPLQEGQRRRKCEKTFGRVIRCSAKGKWEILMLDGTVHKKLSNTLTMERDINFDVLFMNKHKLKRPLGDEEYSRILDDPYCDLQLMFADIDGNWRQADLSKPPSDKETVADVRKRLAEEEERDVNKKLNFEINNKKEETSDELEDDDESDNESSDINSNQDWYLRRKDSDDSSDGTIGGYEGSNIHHANSQSSSTISNTTNNNSSSSGHQNSSNNNESKSNQHERKKLQAEKELDKLIGEEVKRLFVNHGRQTKTISNGPLLQNIFRRQKIIQGQGTHSVFVITGNYK